MSIAPPDTRRTIRPTVSNAIERLIKQQVCVTRLRVCRAQIDARDAPADRTMTNPASHSVPRSLNIIELRDLVPPRNYPVELVEVIELMDGRRTVLRPVLPLDAAKLQAFVKALSPASRYHRFMNGLRELPVSLLEKLTRIDYCSHMALVAEKQCDGIATIIGEARYVIDTSGEAAELAVVVADDWQGLGLAQEMLRRLCSRAMAAGIARFTAETMASNPCILHLARKAGFSIYPVRGVAVLRLEREIDPTRAGV